MVAGDTVRVGCDRCRDRHHDARPAIASDARTPGRICGQTRASCRATHRGSEMSVRSILRCAAFALAGAAVAGSAHAVDIHVGSYVQSGIGSDFETPYDTFSFVGNTFTIVASPTPAAVALGTVSFDNGPNCTSCKLKPSFDAWIDVTVDGVTQPFELTYKWHAAGPQNFLTFDKPDPVAFDFASLGLVRIEIDALPKLSSAGGTVGGTMTAMVTVTPVPEPTTLALILSGLGAIGFVARRRR
jgi:hypothetical protein